MRNLKKPVAFWSKGLVLLVLISLELPAVAASEEEFTGPFPSWRDARRDYGAHGDGEADDTAALQRGLDELTAHTNSCVLYLPAGTYRLTGMLTRNPKLPLAELPSCGPLPQGSAGGHEHRPHPFPRAPVCRPHA